MSEVKDGKIRKRSGGAVIPPVLGCVLGFIFFLGAVLCFFLMFFRTLIGCLILALIYIVLGFILRKILIKGRERAALKITGIILTGLLIPSTALTLYGMCKVSFGPVLYDSYKSFSRSGDGNIDPADVPDYALKSVYLKRFDGRINAVSFTVDSKDIEKYERQAYSWGFIDDPYRGLSIEEYARIMNYSDDIYRYFTDIRKTLKPLIGDDDINDYYVLDSTIANEWDHARFANRKTGRYIIVVTHHPF